MSETIDSPWRPTYEAYAALAWTIGALAIAGIMHFAAMPSGPFYYMLAITGVFALRGWWSALRLWGRKMALMGADLTFIDSERLLQKIRARPDAIWLGWGFEWTRVHAQRMYDLKKRDDVASILPPPPVRLAYRGRRGLRSQRNEKRKGVPWIHGLESRQRDLYVPREYLEGHTLAVATTGWGKTRLLTLLVGQQIHNPERPAIVIVDPKGDKDLRAFVERECHRAGREEDYLFFHPAHPSASCRLDPLKNWNRPTEIASRIAALIPSETGSDAFVAFGWQTINLIANALIYIETRPNLVTLNRYVKSGPDHLLHMVLRTYCERNVDNWQVRVKPYIDQAKKNRHDRPSPATPNEVVGMVQFYRKEAQHECPNDSEAQVVDGLLNMYSHSRDHASKMLASLSPILSMLTSGELGPLLSPDPETDDPRPIADTAKIVKTGKVLYVGLDSMADATVGDAIGSIFLADIGAVAGDNYNYETTKSPTKVYADEAASCMSVPFINLLNKGRGAGFEATIFTQTIPDFTSALGGSEDKMRMVLGNVNNRICGRVSDSVTMEYMTDKFGEVAIQTIMHQQSTTAMTGDKDFTNFTAGYGERLQDTPAPLVPAPALGELPDFEFFAEVAGGKIYKGIIPFVK